MELRPEKSFLCQQYRIIKIAKTIDPLQLCGPEWRRQQRNLRRSCGALHQRQRRRFRNVADPLRGYDGLQSFTLIRTPIIVSDTTTNGAHEPILQRSGGGAETEYVRLVCSDGVYSNPADAEVVEDLAAVTGKAIITNDLTVDMQSGDYLTLADAAKAG